MDMPKYVALKSVCNGKFMCYIKGHGLIQLSGDEAVTPFSIFEVEPSKNWDGMVHLKCRYNNKYFTRQAENSWWIHGAANEPEEERSKWSCTLFKPIFVDDNETIKLWHVQLGHYISSWRTGPCPDGVFVGYSNEEESCHIYKVIDCESMFVLPKIVAFRRHPRCYLAPNLGNDKNLLQLSADDMTDQGTANEVTLTPDGSIQIKVISSNKFWKRQNGYSQWVWANMDEATIDEDSLFWPVKIEKDIVALRNLGNNKFCKRYTNNHVISGLSAIAPSISDMETKLFVVEPIANRKIYNVNYQTMDKRIYNTKITTLAAVSITNTSQQPHDIEFKHNYTNTTTYAWNSILFPKLFSSVHLRANVPIMSGDRVEMVASLYEDKIYEWGESKTIVSPSTLALAYNAIVPPKTKFTVNLVATSVSFDIPFSYTQLDTLINGEQVTYNMEDGIFTGNCFSAFKFESKEEPVA